MITFFNKIKSHLFVVLLVGIILFPLSGMGQKNAKKGKDQKRQDNSALFMEANTQKLLGNYDAAKELFLQCVEFDAQDAASMYELARIARINNQNKEALEWAEQTIKYDPENVWYLKLLAELYQENLQFDKSIEVMENLVEMNPNDLEYLYDLALSNLLVGNYQKSINVYNQIEEKIGVTEEISIQKQKIWLRMEKPDKAIMEIENLCEAWPHETKYKSILAELYMSNGREVDALETYIEIAEIDPENAYIQISLSDYYRKSGDKEKSFEYLKAGFSNPSFLATISADIFPLLVLMKGSMPFFVHQSIKADVTI